MLLGPTTAGRGAGLGRSAVAPRYVLQVSKASSERGMSPRWGPYGWASAPPHLPAVGRTLVQIRPTISVATDTPHSFPTPHSAVLWSNAACRTGTPAVTRVTLKPGQTHHVDADTPHSAVLRSNAAGRTGEPVAPRVCRKSAGSMCCGRRVLLRRMSEAAWLYLPGGRNEREEWST